MNSFFFYACHLSSIPLIERNWRQAGSPGVPGRVRANNARPSLVRGRGERERGEGGFVRGGKYRESLEGLNCGRKPLRNVTASPND